MYTLFIIPAIAIVVIGFMEFRSQMTDRTNL